MISRAIDLLPQPRGAAENLTSPSFKLISATTIYLFSAEDRLQITVQ
jgi:hypothetical protein